MFRRKKQSATEIIPKSATPDQIDHLQSTASTAWEFVLTASKTGRTHVNGFTLRFLPELNTARIEKDLGTSVERLSIVEAAGKWIVTREAYLTHHRSDAHDNIIVESQNFPISTTEQATRTRYAAERTSDGSLMPVQAGTRIAERGLPLSEQAVEALEQKLGDVITYRESVA
jgi:hypothetical protein